MLESWSFVSDVEGEITMAMDFFSIFKNGHNVLFLFIFQRVVAEYTRGCVHRRWDCYSCLWLSSNRLASKKHVYLFKRQRNVRVETPIYARNAVMNNAAIWLMPVSAACTEHWNNLVYSKSPDPSILPLAQYIYAGQQIHHNYGRIMPFCLCHAHITLILPMMLSYLHITVQVPQYPLSPQVAQFSSIILLFKK